MSQFPQFPDLYTAVLTDPQSSSNGPKSSTSSMQNGLEETSNKPAVKVILGSNSIQSTCGADDVPMGTVATGQVISGYNQKQRAALRKGKRDGL